MCFYMIEINNKRGAIADLHVHSRFSRATSNKLSIDNLEKYARIKGVDLLGTGDFQHAEWFKEICEKCSEEREGILYTRGGFPFVWQTEISLMYSQGGRGRRVHLVLLAPNKEAAEQITKFLGSKGRLDYDGRPIFGFSCIELVDNMMEIDKDIEIIPAHCMTPWFGVFGSKSGFDSLKECSEDREGKIHAVESGMSADPEMLRKFGFLNNKSIVSFSDLHSFWPWRIGREATVFSLDSVEKLNYQDLIKQIRENDFLGTVETDPAYGRYHWDGHRKCDFSCSPEQAQELNNICPKCNKQLIIGVESRVNELADQSFTDEKVPKKLFYKMLPLHELISAVKSVGLATKTVQGVYEKLMAEFENEFNILLDVKREQLARVLSLPSEKLLVDLILKNRGGGVNVKPGYDGVYGEMVLDEMEQKTLF